MSSTCLQEVKNNENYNVVTSKSGHGHLQEVVIYDRFQLKDFDWEKFGVLDRWSLIYGRWSLMRGGCTCTFDCISFLSPSL